MNCLVLTHDSALAYWSHPETHAPKCFLTSEDVANLEEECGFRPHNTSLSSLLENRIFTHLPKPVDLLTPYSGERYRTKSSKYHQLSLPYPDYALVPISNSYIYNNQQLYKLMSVSPEMCFTQMATMLNFTELVELGFELCGEYSIATASEYGFVNHEPVTMPEKLVRFTNSARKIPGVQKARKAAKWVLAKSRSPKESQIAMMLYLSRSARGFAVPAPLLNEPIMVSGQTARLLHGKTIVPDLYWPEINTVLEYDSRMFHADDARQERDSRKRNAYRMLGLHVIELTRGQLYDFEVLEKIANDLIKRFGISRRAATIKQREHQEAMHWFLLHGQRRKRFVDKTLF